MLTCCFMTKKNMTYAQECCGCSDWTGTFFSLILGCHNMNWQKLAKIGLCTTSYLCDSVSPVVLFDHIQLATHLTDIGCLLRQAAFISDMREHQIVVLLYYSASLLLPFWALQLLWDVKCRGGQFQPTGGPHMCIHISKRGGMNSLERCYRETISYAKSRVNWKSSRPY